MKTLAEVKRHIDSFSRPAGYNTYAWNITKKTALEVLRCHFENRVYYRPINFLCPEVYQMISMPSGESIMPYKAKAS